MLITEALSIPYLGYNVDFQIEKKVLNFARLSKRFLAKLLQASKCVWEEKLHSNTIYALFKDAWVFSGIFKQLFTTFVLFS